MRARTGHKGKFHPRFPKKYKGDVRNIIWRSTWERKVMQFLDENTNVLEWSSEEIIVPYWSPVDESWHRYFPDFVVVMRKPDGSIKTVMIEVKPLDQTIEPTKKKRVTKKYLTEIMTYGINDAKWKAAKQFCAAKGWEFQIMTEKDIFA